MNFLESIFGLDGKTALVTGGTGGIGKLLAIALSEAGANVIAHGSTPAKADQVAQEWAGRKRLSIVSADLSHAEACTRLVNEAREKVGRLDILVNCAGVNRRKPIRDVTAEDFDVITAVNLKSVFFTCQAAHGVMKQGGGGKIINIGSVTSTDGLGGVAVYGATKAGVAQMTKTMALEWARDNVQVNCLAPGFIMTPLTEKGLWGDPHRREWLLNRIPARRPGTPEDLMGAALLLASHGSDYLTGQVISVDGGYLAGGSWLRDDE